MRYETLQQMRERLRELLPGLTPNSYDNAINRAYLDLARMYPWVNLEGESRIVTKSYVNSSGVIFTNGSPLISASTTISAGWTSGESNGFAGMFVRKRDEAAYYTITASTSSQLTITENYPGKTTTAASSAGDGYDIFLHIYEVTAFETITHVMHDTYMREIGTNEVERFDSDFESEGEPQRWRMAGNNPTTGVTRLQIWPALINDVYELRVRGRIAAATMTATDTARLDSNLITTFAFVELLRRRHLTSPNSVSSDQLQTAILHSQNQFDIAVYRDYRRRSTSKYVMDEFYGQYHKGQQWYVEHDPADAYW